MRLHCRKSHVESEDIQGKFDGMAWGKKVINKKKREAMSDFDRFRVQIAKKKVRALVVRAHEWPWLSGI